MKSQASEQVRVFVPMPDNMSQEIGVSPILHQVLIDSLKRIKGLRVVMTSKNADVILKASLVNYQNTYSKNQGLNIGTATSQAAGGLMKNLGAVKFVSIVYGLKFAVEQDLKALHTQGFTSQFTFESSRRYTEAVGASSVANINHVRERLYFKKSLEEGIPRYLLSFLKEKGGDS